MDNKTSVFMLSVVFVIGFCLGWMSRPALSPPFVRTVPINDERNALIGRHLKEQAHHPDNEETKLILELIRKLRTAHQEAIAAAMECRSFQVNIAFAGDWQRQRLASLQENASTKSYDLCNLTNDVRVVLPDDPQVEAVGQALAELHERRCKLWSLYLQMADFTKYYHPAQLQAPGYNRDRYLALQTGIYQEEQAVGIQEDVSDSALRGLQTSSNPLLTALTRGRQGQVRRGWHSLE